MTQHPSLEAKLRQRIDAFGQTLYATGYYQQLRDPKGSRFRLELRMQTGDRLTSLQQVNDGRYQWTRRDFGEQQTLSRIDLQRVRAALHSNPQPSAMTDPAWLGIGGLSELLRRLSEDFEFESPVAEQISGVPVWRVEGRWQPAALARLLSRETDASTTAPEAPAELPSHVPNQVSLVLGRDGRVPLFPYRFDFLRYDGDAQRSRYILVVELYEVRLRPDFDASRFTFQLGEQRDSDETDAYLKKLGLTP